MTAIPVPVLGWLQSRLQADGNITLLLGAGALLIPALVYVVYQLLFHPLSSYPGPLLSKLTTLPSEWYLFHGTMPFALRDMHLKYGPQIRVGPNELSFAHTSAWKEILGARSPEFPKDPKRITLPPNGYYNILNAPKDEHARFRRLLAHAFSDKGMREQEPRVRQYMDLLVDRLNECADSKEPTNIVDWYTNTVFDVIGDLAWGESFNGLQDRKVHEWIPAVVGNTMYTFQSAVLTRLGLSYFTDYLVNQETLNARKKNYSLATDKAEKRAKMGSGPQPDFWDRVLIKSADDNSSGEGMVKEEMVNNAAVLVLGGAETSATTLSGATYLLGLHPECMKKLAHEVRTAFKSDSEIDLFSVNRLDYGFAVLEETMRIYPPVAEGQQRTPPVGGGFVDGKFIPEHTTIHVPQIAHNFLPSHFTRAWEFLPERWLNDAPAEFAHDDKASFQPFAVGNRNCIGKNLAYAEMRLILAKVIYNFDIELEKEKTGDWWKQKSYGVWVKRPLYVRLRRAKH